MGAVSSPTTILVTGAGGFIGSHVTAAAAARGHRVIGLGRRAGPGVAVLDLGAQGAAAALDRLLDSIDAVIHAAAALGGNDAMHRRDTVGATAALMRALRDHLARTGRAPALVLVSSIAVYDCRCVPEAGVVDEQTPLEAHPEARDAYVRAKLAQEALVTEAATEGLRVSILRPGIVFGPGRLRNAHLGPAIGPLLLRSIGGALPVCSVWRCAEALVLAAEHSLSVPVSDPAERPVAVNILDDDLPDRTRFVAALREAGWPRLVLPCPWRLVLAVATVAERATQLLPGLGQYVGARLPGLLRPAVVHARLKPLGFAAARLKGMRAPSPGRGFEAVMNQAIAASHVTPGDSRA
jgi:nucleoside-diphosphate-sugar epimerase